MQVSYFWYHHGLAWAPEGSGHYYDYHNIHWALDNHKYEHFMKMRAKYPDCFPDEAPVFDENDEIVDWLDITIKDNFMRITYHECECG